MSIYNGVTENRTDTERTCARCATEATKGSRFCGEHRVATDGGVARLDGFGRIPATEPIELTPIEQRRLETLVRKTACTVEDLPDWECYQVIGDISRTTIERVLLEA
ncbi:hypothetical protein [Natronorarus salvus]|uniref:hypothetical protein n=1 Tax=Natronorarus salvus TaxID=3117733 RepID=UPI002F268612